MASVLAQQLQALGVKGHHPPRPKGRPSLLFADQQAADIGTDSIYEIASQGVCRLSWQQTDDDYSFIVFHRSIPSIACYQRISVSCWCRAC